MSVSLEKSSLRTHRPKYVTKTISTVHWSPWWTESSSIDSDWVTETAQDVREHLTLLATHADSESWSRPNKRGVFKFVFSGVGTLNARWTDTVWIKRLR